MGLILDSSVLIDAERRSDNVEKLIERIVSAAGDQDAARSAMGVTEIAHAIYRAQSQEIRLCRQAFIDDILRAFAVYPYTTATALLAARIDGEQQAQGVKIPLPDLLVGVTALELGFSVLTINVRHFRLIPGLNVIQY